MHSPRGGHITSVSTRTHRGAGRGRGPRLLAAGTSNQRIADELVITLDTVKKHVSHVLDKLGASNRTEAASRGRQLGLITYPHPGNLWSSTPQNSGAVSVRWSGEEPGQLGMILEPK